MHALRDEFFRDHDSGGDDVAHGAGGGRDENFGERIEFRKKRFSEFARAEVDGGGGGGADDDGGDAAVEAKDAGGLESFYDRVEGIFVNSRSAFGLHFGFDSIEREEADVGEGAGEAAGGGADEGAVEEGEGIEEGLGFWGGPGSGAGPIGSGGGGERRGVGLGREVGEKRREIG